MKRSSELLCSFNLFLHLKLMQIPTELIFTHINRMSGVKYTKPTNNYKIRRINVPYSVPIDHYHSMEIINSSLIANV